jgi:hypothetical protein
MISGGDGGGDGGDVTGDANGGGVLHIELLYKVS